MSLLLPAAQRCMFTGDALAKSEIQHLRDHHHCRKVQLLDLESSVRCALSPSDETASPEARNPCTETASPERTRLAKPRRLYSWVAFGFRRGSCRVPQRGPWVSDQLVGMEALRFRGLFVKGLEPSNSRAPTTLAAKSMVVVTFRCTCILIIYIYIYISVYSYLFIFFFYLLVCTRYILFFLFYLCTCFTDTIYIYIYI